jgi:hypothetical protein
VADVVDHPLGDQELGQLGQAPGRERQTVVNRSRQSDLFYLLTLGEAERGRPAAGVPRVKGLKAVLVEVVYDLPYPVGAGEAHLGDPGHVHALDRQQHHLCPSPGNHRPRRPTYYAQQPVPLFVRHLSGPQAFPRHHTSDPVTPSQTRMRDRKGQVVDLEAKVGGRGTRCQQRDRRRTGRAPRPIPNAHGPSPSPCPFS